VEDAGDGRGVDADGVDAGGASDAGAVYPNAFHWANEDVDDDGVDICPPSPHSSGSISSSVSRLLFFGVESLGIAWWCERCGLSLQRKKNARNVLRGGGGGDACGVCACALD
jgi:hypothetical protein